MMMLMIMIQGTYDAAMLAAGCAIEAVEAVLKNEVVLLLCVFVVVVVLL